MPRRSKSLIEGLLDLFSTWPWYISLFLAPITYFSINLIVQSHTWGTVEIDINDPTSMTAYMAHFMGQLLLPLLQFALPALLVLASIVSLINALSNQQRYERVIQSSEPAVLKTVDWEHFEQLVGEFFSREGYHVKPTPTGPDGGIDLRIERNGQLYLVQCKQWKYRKVPVSVVRELFGVVIAEGAAGGFIVTSGELTHDAHIFAKGKPIHIINGETFHRFVRQREKAAVRFPPSPNTRPTTQVCPKCEGPMVKRIARRGPNRGESFWGCKRFPKCHGTRP